MVLEKQIQCSKSLLNFQPRDSIKDLQTVGCQEMMHGMDDPASFMNMAGTFLSGR
jgi:hypothetical protein